MRPVIKATILLAVLLTVLAVIHLTPVRQVLEDVHAFSAGFQSLGWWAQPAFTAVSALLIAAGIPRLLICTVAGMTFGFVWGLVWSQVATVVGYYGMFLFVRWSGREYILNRWPKLNRYQHFFKARGFLIVLAIRQMPIAGFYINIVLGLAHIRHVNFILGTALGILPEAVPATLIGAGVLSLSPARSIAAVSAAVAVLIIVWTIVARYLKSLKSKLPPEIMEPTHFGKEEISV